MSLKNWMASIKQSTPLFNISIPGTHESCALHDDNTGGMTKCQSQRITDQLLNGIRFLDIRPTYELNGKPFEISHGGHDQKITFKEVQGQIVDFLQQNPSEVVLMNVQQETERWFPEKYATNRDFVARFNQIVAGFEDYWFFEERIPTIAEARGRIVLIRGYNPDGFDPSNPKNGSWLTEKGIPLNALTIDGNSENDYFITQNASSAHEKAKVAAVEAMIRRAPDNRIRLNYLSYAYFGATPEDNAKKMNPLIYAYIQRFPNLILGVLPMDFAANTPEFIEEIIRHNLQWREVVAGSFSSLKRKEIAVFTDKGNNTTALSLFSPASAQTFQLRQVWEDDQWQATRMYKAVVGDFSGSGKAEIAVFYNSGNHRTSLYLFSAAESFQPEQVWEDDQWQAAKMYKVVVGDFSGSGKAEIAVFYSYPNNRTGLWLFSAANWKEPKRVWDDYQWAAGGMYNVVVGDFSDSGKAEIAVFYWYDYGQTKLWLFSAANWAEPQPMWDSGLHKWSAKDISKAVVGDFSGLGKAEIAVFKNLDGEHVHLNLFSAAKSFDPHWRWGNGAHSIWIEAQISQIMAGDFSGSGKIEIATLYDDNLSMTSLHLFWSAGPDRFQEQEVWHGKL